MFLYAFECTKCKHVHDEYREMKDRRKASICNKCGAQAKLIMSAPYLDPAIKDCATGFYSDHLEKMYPSRKEYYKDLESQGMHVQEPGEKCGQTKKK